MHKARAFFFVCAGIFLLALSYHLGARGAGAQAGISTTSAGSSGATRWSGSVRRQRSGESPEGHGDDLAQRNPTSPW